jgi:hypothetical protein
MEIIVTKKKNRGIKVRKVLLQVLEGVVAPVMGTFFGTALERYRAKMRFFDAETTGIQNILPLLA